MEKEIERTEKKIGKTWFAFDDVTASNIDHAIRDFTNALFWYLRGNGSAPNIQTIFTTESLKWRNDRMITDLLQSISEDVYSLMALKRDPILSSTIEKNIWVFSEKRLSD